MISGLRAYLAGPVENSDDAVSWRLDMSNFLRQLGVVVYDPLIKPDWFPENCKIDPKAYKNVINSVEPSASAIIDTFEATSFLRKACLKMVSSCDFVICYMPKMFTAGTFEEIYLAGNLDKPVLFCMPDGIVSTWVLPIFADEYNYNNVYFKSWADLKSYLARIFLVMVDSEDFGVFNKLKWFPAFYKV